MPKVSRADFNITFCEADRFNFRRYLCGNGSPNEIHVPVNTKGAGILISCRVTIASSNCQTEDIKTMLSFLMNLVTSLKLETSQLIIINKWKLLNFASFTLDWNSLGHVWFDFSCLHTSYTHALLSVCCE